MRPSIQSYTPAALSANGLANDVAYSGGGYALTATTAADGLAHIITILGNAATNHSAKTFTITGTDADGQAQTEGIAGPNGVATVSSTKYYKTVTSVTVSATTNADTFDIGWTGVSVSPTYPIDWTAWKQCNITAAITGTINFSIQETYDDVWRTTTPAQSAPWVAITALASKTATTSSQATAGSTAIRALVNSVTAGATLAIYTSQPRGD